MNKNLVLKSNKYLANVGVNFIKLHNLHWNVVGLQFKAVHEYLESLYDSMSDILDELAELIENINVETYDKSVQAISDAIDDLDDLLKF